MGVQYCLLRKLSTEVWISLLPFVQDELESLCALSMDPVIRQKVLILVSCLKINMFHGKNNKLGPSLEKTNFLIECRALFKNVQKVHLTDSRLVISDFDGEQHTVGFESTFANNRYFTLFLEKILPQSVRVLTMDKTIRSYLTDYQNTSLMRSIRRFPLSTLKIKFWREEDMKNIPQWSDISCLKLHTPYAPIDKIVGHCTKIEKMTLLLLDKSTEVNCLPESLTSLSLISESNFPFNKFLSRVGNTHVLKRLKLSFLRPIGTNEHFIVPTYLESLSIICMASISVRGMMSFIPNQYPSQLTSLKIQNINTEWNYFDFSSLPPNLTYLCLSSASPLNQDLVSIDKKVLASEIPSSVVYLKLKNNFSLNIDVNVNEYFKSMQSLIVNSIELSEDYPPVVFPPALTKLSCFALYIATSEDVYKNTTLSVPFSLPNNLRYLKIVHNLHTYFDTYPLTLETLIFEADVCTVQEYFYSFSALVDILPPSIKTLKYKMSRSMSYSYNSSVTTDRAPVTHESFDRICLSKLPNSLTALDVGFAQMSLDDIKSLPKTIVRLKTVFVEKNINLNLPIPYHHEYVWDLLVGSKLLPNLRYLKLNSIN